MENQFFISSFVCIDRNSFFTEKTANRFQIAISLSHAQIAKRNPLLFSNIFLFHFSRFAIESIVFGYILWFNWKYTATFIPSNLRSERTKNYTFNIEFKSPDFWSNVNVFSVFVFLSVWRKNTNTSVKSIFFCFYGIMPQMVQAILLDITLHQKWISFTWIRIVYDTQISIIWSDMYSVECILCTSCVCAYINQKMKNIAPNKKHFRFQKISSLKPK